jgi:hypothetical protein
VVDTPPALDMVLVPVPAPLEPPVPTGPPDMLEPVFPSEVVEPVSMLEPLVSEPVELPVPDSGGTTARSRGRGCFRVAGAGSGGTTARSRVRGFCRVAGAGSGGGTGSITRSLYEMKSKQSKAFG